MGCCGDSSEVQPIKVNGRALSAPLKGGEEFDGPVKNRTCTDVICLMLFLAFCIGGVIYLIVAYTKGDPNRLIHGYDGNGNVCGQRNNKIEGVTLSGQNYTSSKFFIFKDKKCSNGCPDSTTVVAFYCFPDTKISNQTFSQRLSDFFQRGAHNIETAWREILGTCIIGLVLSIIVILLLRFFAGIIVWITVGVIVIGSIAGTVALWIIWSKNKGKDNAKGLLAAAIIASIFTVITLILLIAMRNRIRLVIQLFTEAGKAVASMPLLLLQPIWTLLVMVIVVGVWLGSWIPIQSSGDFVKTKDKDAAHLKMDPAISYMRIYHVFGFLWVVQFVIGCHLMSIAGAVGKWYFTRDKNKLGNPIFTSMNNVVRYHLGSIAFGALIIAIVQLVRLILKYVEEKVAGQSETLKCLFRCCQCCLWCFENFLKFINKNAYIEISLFGYSFCKGARKAFTVLASNALRLGALNFVGEFVLVLVKLAVIAITGVCGYFIINTNKKIDSVVPGLLIAILVTALIVYCFVSVYDMTIDTLFICFCEDCEQNDGVDKPYYMSRGLMAFVDNSSKAIAALDKRESDAKNNNADWKQDSINQIQIPPNHQQMSSPIYSSKTKHGSGGMTPLHPAYPPVSAPPSPSNFMSRPSD